MPRGGRGEQKEPLSNHGCLYNMLPATKGSAGVDLVTNESVTISDDSVTVINSTTKGPLGGGMAALLLGRSSATLEGIFVLPGVIDADYNGVIKIMVKIFSPPMFIPQGSVIAQLIPFLPQVPTTTNSQRSGGFGSTGPLIAFAQVMTSDRPTRQVTVKLYSNNIDDSKMLENSMMLDTGSDVTIIPLAAWPQQWPTIPLNEQILGVTGTTRTLQSQEFVEITDKEGNRAVIKPYVLDTPLWILGRDTLSQWNVVLTSQHFQERPLSR